MHVTFSINDNTGDVTFLVNDNTRLFVDDSSVIRRASYVLPCDLFLRGLFKFLRSVMGDAGTVAASTREWPCKWYVDLSPINGPVLPHIYTNRALAIQAEIDYLEEYFL